MKLIHEVTQELHQIIVNINQAFISGEFDHLPDPMGERDRLINDALMNTKFERLQNGQTGIVQK